jgi:hypothetical protein
LIVCGGLCDSAGAILRLLARTPDLWRAFKELWRWSKPHSGERNPWSAPVSS